MSGLPILSMHWIHFLFVGTRGYKLRGDLRFYMHTSQICKRLFWKECCRLSNRHHGISPRNFEMQLLFHYNGDLYSCSDVDKLLK